MHSIYSDITVPSRIAIFILLLRNSWSNLNGIFADMDMDSAIVDDEKYIMVTVIPDW